MTEPHQSSVVWRQPPTFGILLVDPQNDFFPGGALGVADGDQIIAPINELIFKTVDAPVFVSADWHPANSRHFKERGGIWVPHCIQKTTGAMFHKDIRLPTGTTVVLKGANPEDDGGYSAFDGVTEDGRYNLHELLKDKDIKVLIVAGLATDYCVKATVIRACQLGYMVMVYEPGIRAVNINPQDGTDAIAEMTSAGAYLLR